MPSECRYWFFSGKGGVGKTSLSAATAVHFAEAGKRTLIITTDPASNLADVFEQKIGHNITTIQGIRNLWAMELDPDEATAEYKERTMAPLRGVMPESILKVMEEQLDSPCTSEMAVFERFVDFLDEDEFDVVIFDTAPTGHTLRLLQLPADWSQVIEQAAESGAATCVGPAQGLADSKIKFDRALLALKDRHLTKFIFVLRPETSSIDETARSMREMVEIGVNNFELVVNGIIPAEAATNAFFKAKRLSQLGHLKTIVAMGSAAKAVYLQSREIRGIECLRTAGQLLHEKPLSIEDAGAPSNSPSPQKGVSAQNRKLPPAVSVPIGLSENCRPH
ncbi:MAG: TRC40/GET3/ArsA family transport-energizing ATPase, partial [Actinomycetia bacterium]|nr:TRC40/GET3/ArsA family transport-energizing ATPase [Actinomycetes bacterium]